MKPTLIATLTEAADLSGLKGALNEEKRRFLENEWTRFRLRTGWQPNRLLLKALRKREAYALVLDQQDSVLRFGILNAQAVKASDSFPDADRTNGGHRGRAPLGDSIFEVRAAGKIPIVLTYWANPQDCASDDDIMILTYESMPGTVST